MESVGVAIIGEGVIRSTSKVVVEDEPPPPPPDGSVN